MAAIGGVIATVAFVQGVEKIIPVCEAVDQKSMDWTNFNNIVSTVWSKESRMEALDNDIIYNGQSITNDIRSAIEALKEEKYSDFGFQLGATLDAATKVDKSLFLY